MGVKEPDNEEYEYYYTLMWYHPDCLKKCMRELGMKKVKAESFSGFTFLRPADKKKLRMMCGESDEADQNSAADSGKGKGCVITQKFNTFLDQYSIPVRREKDRPQVDQLKRRAKRRVLKKKLLK